MACRRLLLISGAMGAGKTHIANTLRHLHQFQPISSGAFLRSSGGDVQKNLSRADLQDLGDALDVETDFRWIVDDVARPAITAAETIENWLLDAVRKPKQIQHFKDAFGESIRHIHLFAPEDVLRARYLARGAFAEQDYLNALSHPNEIAARSLHAYADATFDSTTSTAEEIASSIFQLWGGQRRCKSDKSS